MLFKEYLQPVNLNDAVNLLSEQAEISKILAVGTDLVLHMRAKKETGTSN